MKLARGMDRVTMAMMKIVWTKRRVLSSAKIARIPVERTTVPTTRLPNEQDSLAIATHITMVVILLNKSGTVH